MIKTCFKFKNAFDDVIYYLTETTVNHTISKYSASKRYFARHQKREWLHYELPSGNLVIRFNK